MLPRTTSIWQRDSQPNASGKPGAVQCRRGASTPSPFLRGRLIVIHWLNTLSGLTPCQYVEKTRLQRKGSAALPEFT